MKVIEEAIVGKHQLLCRVVENALRQRHGDGAKLKNLTTEIYGGTGYTAELWEKAWDAVLVWDSLTWFPIIAGNVLKRGNANEKLFHSKVDALTNTAMRVLS